MQNSKLSNNIFPRIRKDWLDFVELVQQELNAMKKENNRDIGRIKDLARYISKLEEIKEVCKDNIEAIFKYRDFFAFIGSPSEEQFNSLEFLRSQNNLDNDGVVPIYYQIVNSPKIDSMTSKYQSLLVKAPFVKKQIDSFEDLVNGLNYNIELIKEFMDKYGFDDNKKKNILFYTVVMSSIRQEDIKEVVDKKQDNRDKFKALVDLYHDLKEKNNILLSRSYQIKESINQSEYDIYKGYINNPSDADNENFRSEVILKIYVLAVFKLQKDIEQYIGCISELQSGELNLNGEIKYFRELVDEYKEDLDKIRNLIKSNKIILEGSTLFALNSFNRLIVDPELIKNDPDVETFVDNYDTRDKTIRVVQMNIPELEELLRREIYMVTTPKSRLAYIMVNNCALILMGTSINDNKFNQKLNNIVRLNLLAIRKQIELISERNDDYLDLEKEIIDNVMKSNTK